MMAQVKQQGKTKIRSLNHLHQYVVLCTVNTRSLNNCQVIRFPSNNLTIYYRRNVLFTFES